MTIRMKDKYDLTRDNKVFRISSINDRNVRFAAKVLARKWLCKVWSTKCIVGVVALAELCAKGVQINWSQFLLNELLADAVESQEKDNAFHYS